MEFKDLIEHLEFENKPYLIESGSPQKLRHYTDMRGLFFILKEGYIKRQNYWYGKSNSICVVRPSSHINDFNDKSYCGYFEIDFEILNDKIRNLKKIKINELEETYRSIIENIAKKYSINKEIYLKACKFIYDASPDENSLINWIKKQSGIVIAKQDANEFIRNYDNMIYSLYYREGEERIFGADIPINPSYMKLIKLENYDELYNQLNDITKKQIQQKLSFYNI